MSLGSTQPLTEMSTRIHPGGKGWPGRKADITAICKPIVQKMWEPRRLTTLRTSTACYRDSFTFFTVLDVENIFSRYLYKRIRKGIRYFKVKTSGMLKMKEEII
jgi:hypothetical protein